MALDWPTDLTPMESNIQPRDQVVGDQSPFTGSREVMLRWHQWHATMTFNHLINSDALRLQGYLSRCRGGLSLMKVPIFSYRAARGTKSGTVTLNSAHAAGVTSLTITGGAGTFLQGDWFSIGSASETPHAYLVVSSESANVIQIVPGLRVAQNSGTQLVISLPIHDTMELPSDPTFPLGFPSPLPGFFQPFTVEFVTAIRANY